MAMEEEKTPAAGVAKPSSPPPTENVTPSLPQAVVTVPKAGLRVKHSLDAQPVAKVTLRDGEKVFVLKKYSPGTGPSWVQVQTKSGKVGWVFASVLKDGKWKRQ